MLRDRYSSNLNHSFIIGTPFSGGFPRRVIRLADTNMAVAMAMAEVRGGGAADQTVGWRYTIAEITVLTMALRPGMLNP